MTGRKPAKSPRGKGRPFQKGEDRRRNMGGNLNAAAQSYEIRFRNALAEKLAPEEFAEIVIQEVRKHRPGAREFYADRLMGKVKDRLEHSGEVKTDNKLTVEIVHVKPEAKK